MPNLPAYLPAPEAPTAARYFDIDGRLTPLEGASAAPGELFNSAMLDGFGTYETYFCSAGRPAFFAEHFRRLTASLRFFGLPAPAERARELYERVLALTAANGLAHSRLRLDVCLRGDETPFSCLVERGVEVEYARPELPAVGGAVFALQRDGRFARDARRLPAYVKSGSAHGGYLAARAARALGAEEAVVMNFAGHVCEGSFCNLFWIRGKTLYTPALSCGLLDGIARDVALSAARRSKAFERIVEGEFRPEDLLAADAAFLTSSVRGPWPIASLIDGASRREYAPRHELLAVLRRAYFEDLSASFTAEL